MAADDRTAAQRRGSYALSDVADPRLAVVCGKCDRRGDYDVARLIATRGDLTLPDLLRSLAQGCTAPDGTGRCGVAYARLPRFR